MTEKSIYSLPLLFHLFFLWVLPLFFFIYSMSQLAIIRELLDKDQQPKSVKKANTLRFKMEPIGMQLKEEDDDLHTCPSRTRPQWPRQIHPWWKPADRFEKPPYSYATLIAHAILSSKDGRLTLSDIYQWISEVYPYYQKGVKGWQVMCFMRVFPSCIHVQ